MSRENVEVVRGIYDQYAAGDIDGLLSRVDPEIEFDLSDRLPDEGLHRGREAYRQFLKRTFELWADFQVEVEDLLDGGDAVVAIIHTTATGRASGIEIDERVGHVFWLRDEIPYRFKVFSDRSEALAAAGLSGG
ncbi:MAG TPA: nuclear transport factor 2 family protein [Solirubrobacterales bacterium]|nr:nuclear transport factor 2 family protein [Solirubrobacterales bacterium]